MNSIEDLAARALFGCSKEEFLRSAGLLRNPENYGEHERCPICKSRIKIDAQGDRRCETFSIAYEKKGGCYWHRYADGTNYWSDPVELVRVLSKKTGIPMPKGIV